MEIVLLLTKLNSKKKTKWTRGKNASLVQKHAKKEKWKKSFVSLITENHRISNALKKKLHGKTQSPDICINADGGQHQEFLQMQGVCFTCS